MGRGIQLKIDEESEGEESEESEEESSGEVIKEMKRSGYSSKNHNS